jgi:DNA polymerase-3 subunit chi
VSAAATPKVDFYVLPGTEPRARLKFACRIAEKAYLAEQRLFVWLEDAVELQSFDELLWTFADRSFVPHEIFSDAQQWRDTPVLLGCEAQPQQPFDLLLNLGSEVPAAAARAGRIAEIVDAQEPRRRAGRNRFRHYRDLGLTPETHNIAANDTP